MYIVVFVTVPNKNEANYMAKKIIEKKLAACVNIIDNITSLFRWEGKIDRCKEFLLIIKARKSKLPSLIKLVKDLHTYEVPEIIALPIIAGEKNYLRWIDACC